MKPPRILFASPFVPYAKAGVLDDAVDFFYYRNTLAQGLFQLRQLHSWHPLHYLAQNLPVESAVLENPTWEGFQEEVRTGGYDVVALTFTIPTARKALEMATWLKAEHPQIEVVVGGYGTAIFKESFGLEQELAARVDRVCTGEGLAFMRAYLRERWGVQAPERPHRQELVPSRNSLFRTRVSLYEQLSFVRSLGCPNACAFCATSSHYGAVKIPVLTGPQLYEVIRDAARRHPGVMSGIVYDENFLEDRADVLAFMERMDQDEELKARPFLLTVFSSVKSISQFTVEELVRCGIGTIFVGVESFEEPILAGEALAKRAGRDVATLFEELHAAGINTLGSMIVGWDAHTREKAQQELDRFVALNPTFYQVVPLHPLPGTALWKRMKEAGRIIPSYRYEEDGVARTNFAFKHLADEQVQAMVVRTYERLVEEGGPWPFRLVENLYRGWRALAKSPRPAYAARARGYAKMLGPLMALVFVSRLLFWGAGFRKRWAHTVRGLLNDFPVRTLVGLVLSPIALLGLGTLFLAGAARFRLSKDGDPPETLVRRYPAA